MPPSLAPSDSLPPLTTVARALQVTTEWLAHECACPSPTAPQWDDFHWRIAMAVAAMQGVSPLLSRTLRWRGPGPWQGFVAEQWQHTLERHGRIDELIARIDTHARQRGIALLALKGAALHALAVYGAGMRPMADVDLLVNDADSAAAVSLLAALDYEEIYRTRRERTFAPRASGHPHGLGEHAGNAIKIELHTRIAERLPVREYSISELLLPPRAEAGLHSYRCVADLMTHLLLHAAGNMRSRTLRLIQLNDIAALAPLLDLRQWQRVLSHQRAGTGAARWAYPPLALTARYYADVIPAPVLARARAACRGVLAGIGARQRLSDVSLSHLWVEFCPGIEWCSSLTEVMRYMRGRAFPDRHMRGEVRTCETTQIWALESPWSALSRSSRVRRWLFSRVPRMATLWSVRAAGAWADESGA
jgi:hypothetical protein